MSPEQAVRARLLATVAVTTLVGQRIYMLMLPQRPTLPAVRIQTITHPQEKHLRGPNGTTKAAIQVDVFVEESDPDPYQKLEDISDAITNALVVRPFTIAVSPGAIRVEMVKRTDRRPLFEFEEPPQWRMLNEFEVSSKAA